MSNDDSWDLSKRRASSRGASRFAHVLLFVIAAHIHSVGEGRETGRGDARRGPGHFV